MAPVVSKSAKFFVESKSQLTGARRKRKQVVSKSAKFFVESKLQLPACSKNAWHSRVKERKTVPSISQLKSCHQQLHRLRMLYRVVKGVAVADACRHAE